MGGALDLQQAVAQSLHPRRWSSGPDRRRAAELGQLGLDPPHPFGQFGHIRADRGGRLLQRTAQPSLQPAAHQSRQRPAFGSSTGPQALQQLGLQLQAQLRPQAGAWHDIPRHP